MSCPSISCPGVHKRIDQLFFALLFNIQLHFRSKKIFKSKLKIRNVSGSDRNRRRKPSQFLHLQILFMKNWFFWPIATSFLLRFLNVFQSFDDFKDFSIPDPFFNVENLIHFFRGILFTFYFWSKIIVQPFWMISSWNWLFHFVVFFNLTNLTNFLFW